MLKIEKEVMLKNYSTFAIGGIAKFFAIAKDISEIKEALEFSLKQNIPIFILGGGSNILFSDNGFNGIILKIQNEDFKAEDTKVICGAGLSLAKLIKLTLENRLSGLEFMAGVPGTIGGAIFGNSGAFGKEIGDFVERVEAIDINSLEDIILDKNECEFEYRNSLFKKSKNYLEKIENSANLQNHFVLTKVELRLKKENIEDIKKEIEKNILTRGSNLPYGNHSAGCIFKNFKFKEIEDKVNLSERFLELKSFKEKGSISTAYLIDRCGLKGKRIGGAEISKKNPNFILNVENAKAEDVMILASIVKQKVRNKFGIQLKEEIDIIGF